MKLHKIVLSGLVLFVGILILIFLSSGLSPNQHYNNLPWQSRIESEDKTSILGLNIGTETLKEVINKLRHMPDIAYFKSKEKNIIEAYFGKLSVSGLEGRIIVEIDTNEHFIKKIDDGNLGDPMPSGNRKFELSEKQISMVNTMRVWKLVYIPTTNYDSAAIEKFFGKPQTIKKINDTTSYLHYPEKGLIIMQDTKEAEIFYYSSKKDYTKLIASLKYEQ